MTDCIYHCRSPHTFLTVLGGFRLCWYAAIALHPKSSNIQVPNRTEGGVSAVALIQVCLLGPEYDMSCRHGGLMLVTVGSSVLLRWLYLYINNVVFKCSTWAEVDHLTPQWGTQMYCVMKFWREAGNMSGWLNINVNKIAETEASGWFDAVL